jgi:Ni/Co efflux regulator RcnB
MKKFLIASLAASMLATPLIATAADAAPEQRHTTVVRHQPGRTIVVNRTVTRKPAYRRWNKGQRFDSRYAQNYQVIGNWQSYRGRHLYAPPRGYHWVRSGNDAVLVAVTGGLIGAVLAGAFN